MQSVFVRQLVCKKSQTHSTVPSTVATYLAGGIQGNIAQPEPEHTASKSIRHAGFVLLS
jgi:hypothetical protein